MGINRKKGRKQNKKTMAAGKIPGLAKVGLAGLLGLSGLGYAGYKSIYTVDSGYQAVVFNQITGLRSTTYSMGTHFLIPFIERPYLFDIRRKATVRISNTGSKDLQMVKVSLRILHMPDTNKLQAIVQELGLDYANRVLPSIANEVLGSTIAQFTAAQLITKRELVSNIIKKKLTDRAADFHLILDDVSITHFDFASEYQAAVEAKQVAQQQAERAKFTVEKALQVKEEIIVRAEAEARAATEFNSQLAKDRSGNFLALRRLQAAQEIAEIIANGGNRVYLSADALLFNVLDRHNKSSSDVLSAPTSSAASRIQN